MGAWRKLGGVALGVACALGAQACRDRWGPEQSVGADWLCLGELSAAEGGPTRALRAEGPLVVEVGSELCLSGCEHRLGTASCTLVEESPGVVRVDYTLSFHEITHEGVWIGDDSCSAGCEPQMVAQCALEGLASGAVVVALADGRWTVGGDIPSEAPSDERCVGSGFY